MVDIKIVRADGRQFSMNDTSMSDLLKNTVTVRVEEFVLKIPDGRSAVTLINARRPSAPMMER